MKIKTYGMKHRDHDVSLGKLSLLAARNGAGKTTIADAIRLAFLSYVPAIGKRLSDSAVLMRGNKLAVELVLDDGRTIDFQLATTGQGGYTSSTECSWLTEKGDAAREQARALVGKEESDAAEVLDARLLVTAPVSQRAARIQALVASSAKTAQEIFRAVSRYTVQRLAGVTDERMPARAQELRPLIEASEAGKAQYAILVATADQQRAKLSEGIAIALTWANAEKRAADQHLRQQRAAKAELEQRLQGLPETNPSRLAELEAQRDAINRAIGATTERLTAAESRVAAITEAREAHTRAEGNLQAATEAWDKAQNRRPELVAKRTMLAGVVKALDELTAPPLPPAIATTEELVVLRGRLASIQKEIDAIAVPVLATSNEIIVGLEQQERLADEAVTRIALPEVSAELVERVAALDAALRGLLALRDRADQHPLRQLVAHLATFRAEWRALGVRTPGAAKLVNDFCDKQHAGLVAAMGESNSASLSTQIDAAEAELVAARSELDAQNQALDAAMAERDALCRQATEFRALAQTERDRLARAHADALSNYQAKIKANTTQRDLVAKQIEEMEAAEAKRHEKVSETYQKQREGHDTERRALTRKRDEFTALIAQLEAEDKAAEQAFNDAVAAYESADQRLEDVGGSVSARSDESEKDEPDLEAQRAAVVAEIEQLQGAAATTAQLQAIIADISRDEARSVVFKALEEACKRVRDEEIDASGGPIAALMDQMLAAAGRKEKAIVGSDMVGWMAPDVDEPAIMRQVDVKALSGGEYQYYLGLLTAADMILRGAEVRPLLVEAGEMDERLLRAMCASIAAIADRLTLCLIARWGEVETPAGWERVHLDAHRERAAA